MKYRRRDAKDYARAAFQGHLGGGADAVCARPARSTRPACAGTCATGSTTSASTACSSSGKQGEFFSMSVAERKRTFEIAVDEIGGQPHHPVVLGPEPRRGHRSRQARAGDRRRLHRGACAGAAFPPRAGRDALRVLPHDQRAGGDRHRAVEPSRQRLPDEPGAVRPHRRNPERGRHQVQRAARDVRAADAARRRQDPGQHAPPRRNGSTTSSSSAGSSICARRRPICCRPGPTGACANTPTSPCAARWRAPRPCATASIRCARRSGARGRRRNSIRIRNTGRTCWARSAARCAAPMLELTRGREGRDAPRLRGLRPQARSARQALRCVGGRRRRRKDGQMTTANEPATDDCTPSTSRTGSARTSTCSSRRSATRRCSRTAR